MTGKLNVLQSSMYLTYIQKYRIPKNFTHSKLKHVKNATKKLAPFSHKRLTNTKYTADHSYSRMKRGCGVPEFGMKFHHSVANKGCSESDHYLYAIMR